MNKFNIVGAINFLLLTYILIIFLLGLKGTNFFSQEDIIFPIVILTLFLTSIIINIFFVFKLIKKKRKILIYGAILFITLFFTFALARIYSAAVGVRYVAPPVFLQP